MIKFALLAGVIAISAPAFAQDMPVQDSTVPQEAPAGEQTVPAAPAPESDVQAEAESTLNADASASPQATTAQIAQMVESEFAKYDKDSTGELDQEQFGEWMVALRAASEPNLSADARETQAWIGQAFTQADTDKSAGVSKEELTGFLAPSAS